jgi:uncharacterized protein (DUF2147 family)
MTYLRNLFSGVFVALLVVPAWAQAPAGELGRWVTESGNLEVEIAPCGAALCGTVVEVLANRSMSNPGTTMTPAARPVLGMKILTDFVPGGDRQWKGYIYNRENGKTYRCRMTLLESGHLEIHAYVGLPLFGKTQIWRRVADPGRSSQ